MEMPAGNILFTNSVKFAQRWSVVAALTLLVACTSFFAIRDFVSSAAAVDEERTISFYNIHNKETIEITYKKNGRYIPSAMQKLNHFLRDWRRDEPTKMDPELIDLIWELRQELGSTEPTHVISGYRSPKTNAMLRRIGRKVARRSMHMRGQASDVYFPDVKLKDLRNSALVRQVGGVGYYPRSGERGFVHVDTGNVRHWPRMSKTKLAAIFRNHKNKPKHEPRKNEKGPIYMVQRNRSTDNDSIAASPDNIKNALTTAENIPLPRPKPVMTAAVTPPAALAQVPTPIKPEPMQPPVIAASATPVMASVTSTAPATTDTDTETEEAPQLRRSLVFFPLAILKRDALPDQIEQDLGEDPVSVQQVTMVNTVPTTANQAVSFMLIENEPQRTLTASQLARAARQVVTRDGKSQLLLTEAARPVSNETDKGEFLKGETTIIDLRGPAAPQQLVEEQIEETVRDVQATAQAEPLDAAGEVPVAIPAGAGFSYR